MYVCIYFFQNLTTTVLRHFTPKVVKLDVSDSDDFIREKRARVRCEIHQSHEKAYNILSLEILVASKTNCHKMARDTTFPEIR